MIRPNLFLTILFSLAIPAGAAPVAADSGPPILTPPSAHAPRINGPTLFGVRPGSPFFYSIPATGDRPMQFGAEGLPSGLSLDPATGQITGSLAKAGKYEMLLTARNALGAAQKHFRIVVGESIALTPAMGWNSWNCWAEAVSQERVLQSARALISSGLVNHGWSYVNIDDTWQGERTGPDHALQSNTKFPDMKALCAAIHGMGLKAGIYSTPWITSYAKFPGGSSDSPSGTWDKSLASAKLWRHGQYSFARADARQWATWGFDYLKYDWNPNEVPHVAEMSKALRDSGRDIVFSLSNTAPFAIASDLARLANSWRTTSDIRDLWVADGQSWQYGVSEIGFSQDPWAPYAGPGHWNDPDMLVVGSVGWGNPKPARLTPDEQYSHISLWCLLSAPLLIGCDLEKLDPFTLNLLTNDEVLALDQDALGRQAVRVATEGGIDVYSKDLEDGSRALGFFNRDSTPQTLRFKKLGYIGFGKRQHVRDLWRQQDLPDIADPGKNILTVILPPHGVMLYKLTPADPGP
jgi:alpha-galactosidase